MSDSNNVRNGNPIPEGGRPSQGSKADSPMRACLMGAGFEFGNRGVGALAAGALTCILTRYPNAEVTIVGYGMEDRRFSFSHDGSTVEIDQVNLRFSKRLFLPNNVGFLLLKALAIRLLPGRTLRRRRIESNRYLRLLAESDGVFSIAGGDSFSDIYGMKRFFYITLPQLLALAVNAELILLPQTLGPFKRRSTRFLARLIMRRARTVISRDRLGKERWDKWLDSGTIRVCPDVAFVMAPTRPARLEEAVEKVRASGRPVVGLNVSGLLYSGGYTQNNMFGLKADYKELIDRLIRHFVEAQDAQVMLVPHVFGSRDDVDDDVKVSEGLYESLRQRWGDRLTLVRENYNHSEIKYVIGLSDFFVGSRMHSCIAAVSQGIPAVSIAYSDKFKGVMETLGVEKLVADARHSEEEDILKLVDSAFGERQSLRDHLERVAPEVRDEVLRTCVE